MGITDEQERHQLAQCIICELGCVEDQVHTSTTCTHRELTYIRGIYESILTAFEHIQLPKKDMGQEHNGVYSTTRVGKYRTNG